MSEVWQSMSDAGLLGALGIAGAVLLSVTVFIIFISYVTVNRGEVEMKKRGGGHH